MKLSAEQLEWIVREVVRRLQSSAASARPTDSSRRLAIADRLVTTETLRNKLEGVTHVDVISRAVITPAVVDLLRERQIALVRNAGR